MHHYRLSPHCWATLYLLCGCGTAEKVEDCQAAGRSLIQSKVTSRWTRDCAELVRDDCSFQTEEGNSFLCKIEHGSRLMYTTWIRPGSSVLEVGARYGQTTCLLSKLLQPDSTGARLHASDADPQVWDVLEGNLYQHGCHATVVRGPVGTSSLKFELHNYGSRTISLDDPRPGVVVPAHSLRSLNATFDTLAIDCEGCFGSFLAENPDLLEMLSMIVVEVHGDPGPEQEAVDKLISEGWELKQRLRRQRVLCKGPCESQCDLVWVAQHAHQYWGEDLW